MGEQREFEKIADAGVNKLETLETDYRASLIVAWMAISIKHAEPQQRMGQIIERLDELKPAELLEAWAGIQDGQSPPAQTQPGNDGSDRIPSNGSGEDSEPAQVSEIQHGIGTQHSDTGATSDRETSAA